MPSSPKAQYWQGTPVWKVKGSTPSADAEQIEADLQQTDDLENSIYTKNLMLKLLSGLDGEKPRTHSASTATTETVPESPAARSRVATEELHLAPSPTSRRTRGGKAKTERDGPRQQKTFLPMMPYGGVLPMPPWCYADSAYLDQCAAFQALNVEEARRSEAIASAQKLAQSRFTPDELATIKQETRVRKQIEYYFSEKNIVGDMYLRSCMDADGFVQLEKLLAFPMVKKLGTDVPSSSLALAVSTVLEVSEDKQSIRLWNKAARDEYPRVEQNGAIP